VLLPKLMSKKFIQLTLGLATSIWLVVVASGIFFIERYANRSGDENQSASSWPPSSHLSIANEKVTAILFAHPKCSCSEASVVELDHLMARTQSVAKIYVVFVRPPMWSDADVKSDLWKQVAKIPGIESVIDNQGEEAKKFGALTSGMFFVYNTRGTLAFKGGITGSRGHVGDNVGLESAIEAIRGEVPKINHSKTFGCALFSQSNVLDDGLNDKF